MFKDIGYKIETVASVVCAIGIIISLMAGFVLVVEHNQMLIGLIIALGGILVSWLSTILIYGFGTLVRTNEEMKNKIDNLTEIAAQQQRMLSLLVKITREQKEQE